MSINDGIQEWWHAVPIATRYMFSSAGLLTMASNFGLMKATRLLWIPEMVYQSFEIWRIVTSFLYMGQLGFPMLINLVFLLQYSRSLEQQRFAGRLADYVFMLTFGCSILLVLATLLNLVMLCDGLIMLLIYVWARTNPNVDVTFLFGIRFKAAYFPWVLIGFNILLGGFPLMYILGALVGHLYIYLKDIYPQVSGKYYLNTPQFFINLIPHGAGVNEIGGAQQPHVPVPQPRGWGAGQRLGGR